MSAIYIFVGEKFLNSYKNSFDFIETHREGEERV